MAKTRQDAWSHEDDLLLAETVLRHIREGSTQLNAFEEVGDHLNRTSAACGFRWNAEVRDKYINAIDIAKKQRKDKKRRLAKQQANTTPEPETQNDSIALPYSEEKEEHHLLEASSANNQKKRTTNGVQTDITLDSVIDFLTGLKQDYDTVNQSQSIINELRRQNNEQRDKIDTLNRELKSTQTELTTIKEDYQVFMQIMDRARKMTVLEDEGTLQAPSFRMDKNGNLEQIVQSSGQ